MPNNETNTILGKAGEAVLEERIRALTEVVEELRKSLTHMATKEQVAQLVGRNEFDRQTWEMEQLRRDLEREAKLLREEIERSSARKMWGNMTSIVSGLLGIISLIVVITGWRPGA